MKNLIILIVLASQISLFSQTQLIVGSGPPNINYYNTIQGALDYGASLRANGTAQQVIITVEPGIYHENIVWPDYSNNLALLDNITIQGVDKNSCIIDASLTKQYTDPAGNVLTVGSGFYFWTNGYWPLEDNIIIKNLTIINGSGTNISGGVQGGGICVNNHCTPIFEDLIIKQNSTTNNGGGIYYRNTSSTENLIIKNCEITDNTANEGCGIFIYDGYVEIENCIINSNEGNGSHNSQPSLNIWGNSSVSVKHTRICGNDFGVLLQGSGVNASFEQVLISGNSGGSAVSVIQGSTIELNYCTVSGNYNPHGNAGIIFHTNGNGTIENSIIFDNYPREIDISSGGVLNIFDCDVKDYGTSNGIQNNGGSLNAINIMDDNPMFVNPVAPNPVNNISGDYHLQASSPCLSKSNDDDYYIEDIDYDPRPQPSCTSPDLGAYENAYGYMDIQGFKFNDIDNDGEYNPMEGDYKLPNWYVYCSDENGVSITLTDENGKYIFENKFIGPEQLGTISIWESTNQTHYPGWVWDQTFPNQGSHLPSYMGLTADEICYYGNDLNFGNHFPQSALVEGFKFNDLDKDGVYEPQDGEIPMANHTITLKQTYVNPVTGEETIVYYDVLTDVNGNFFFSLVKSVSVDMTFILYESRDRQIYPDGEYEWYQTYPTPDMGLIYDLGNLSSGTTYSGYIFGNSLDTDPISLSGFKYNDIDGNGEYDPSIDQKLANYPISIYFGGSYSVSGDGYGIAHSGTGLATYTDENGEYHFTASSGPFSTHTIVEGSYNFVNSTQTQPSSQDHYNQILDKYGYSISFSGVKTGEGFNDLNFGNHFEDEFITGIKFNDINEDGIYQPEFGETPISNWAIYLYIYDVSGNYLSGMVCLTDDDGRFFFDIIDFSSYKYVLCEHDPDAGDPYFPWFPTAPQDIGLTINAAGTTFQGSGYDFLVSSDPPQPGFVYFDKYFGNHFENSYVSGMKFNDMNANGIYEPELGEHPIEGWTLYLKDNDGNIIATATTDIQGRYLFTLEDGLDFTSGINYFVSENQSPEWFQIYPGDSEGYNLIGAFQGQVITDLNFANYFPEGYRSQIEDIESHVDYGNTLLVYPNPSSDVINVSYNVEKLQNGKIVISNVAGKTIYENNIDFSSGKTNIDISRLKQGYYIISIKDGSNAIMSKSFVKL